MKQGQPLGSLETQILFALARLDGTAHGMIVRREIEEPTLRNVSHTRSSGGDHPAGTGRLKQQGTVT
jgi:hypothetical protein